MVLNSHMIKQTVLKIYQYIEKLKFVSLNESYEHNLKPVKLNRFRNLFFLYNVKIMEESASIKKKNISFKKILLIIDNALKYQENLNHIFITINSIVLIGSNNNKNL